MNILEKAYYYGLKLRLKSARSGMKRLPCRVISIGNLTVGGTGKTPASIAVCREAISRGYVPVVLTRGYRGRAEGPCIVSLGEGPLMSVEDAGDEPYLMASAMPGVAVVKSASRYEGGLLAIKRLGDIVPDFLSRAVFVLDDGFQHIQLFRDRDIVLIDAENAFGGGRLLPVGRLREPVESLGRADIIIITKAGDPGERGNAVTNTIDAIRAKGINAPIFISDHNASDCLDMNGMQIDLSAIAGEKVFGFCGIASPDSFRNTLRKAGAEITGFIGFRDHHRYSDSDIKAVRDQASLLKSRWIVTTEKDIIKIRRFDLPENTLVLRVEFSVEKRCFDEIFRFDSTPLREDQ